MNERRDGVRVDLDVAVAEKLVDVSARARAVNLSCIGIRYVKPGGASRHGSKEVFLEFSLPEDTEPIKVLGWVVEEVEKDGNMETAVTYMFLQEKDRKKIDDYVTKRLP